MLPAAVCLPPGRPERAQPRKHGAAPAGHHPPGQQVGQDAGVPMCDAFLFAYEAQKIGAGRRAALLSLLRRLKPHRAYSLRRPLALAASMPWRSWTPSTRFWRGG